jgi:hypothetical protein
VVCASANVLVRVNAVANAIVVAFMIVSFCLYIGGNRAVYSTVPFNSSLTRSRRQAIVFRRKSSRSSVIGFPAPVKLDGSYFYEWVRAFLEPLPFIGFRQPLFHLFLSKSSLLSAHDFQR